MILHPMTWRASFFLFLVTACVLNPCFLISISSYDVASTYQEALLHGERCGPGDDRVQVAALLSDRELSGGDGGAGAGRCVQRRLQGVTVQIDPRLTPGCLRFVSALESII